MSARHGIRGRLFTFWVRCALLLGTAWSFPRGLAPRRSRRPLLLLSLPRAGSTWIGRLLASHPRLHYHFEPLNPTYSTWVDHHHECRQSPERWGDLSCKLGQVLEGKSFSWLSLLYQPPWRFWTAAGICIKEVHGLFSIPLLRAGQCDVVLLVRHPCAIAQSHVARGLMPDFGKLLEGDCPDWFGPHRPLLLEEAEGDALAPWRKLGAYWALGYGLACDQLDLDRVHVLRYEDISAAPETLVPELFDQLSLSFTPRIARNVAASAHARDETYTRRDSRQLTWRWRSNLSPSQVDAVLEGVRRVRPDVYERFYPAEERLS